MNSPGISVFIPPRVFLACLVCGAALEWIAPTAFPVSSTAVRWVVAAVGLAIIVGGIAFMGWGHGRFTKVGTAVRTSLPATELVTSGAYRFSRNPMYVGFVTMLLGSGVALASLPMLLSAAVFFVFLDRFVVPKEERYLRSRFGDPYDAYRSRVRRWL